MTEMYLSEAFQSLRELNEEVFDLNTNGTAELKDFVSDDEEVENIDIIDPLASTEEELQDSYIGKVILDCSICQSKLYKNPEEVTIDDEAALANVGDECPYCRSTDGYKVIGEVAPYSETEVDVEVTPKEDGSEEANIDLTTEENKDDEENLSESINNINIDTDKETINVSTTEKQEEGEEMIAPIEPETEEQFNHEEVEEAEEPEYQDVDIDEFDENEFDELGESYLKRVYENVKSYKTVEGKVAGNKLKLEGIITFKSGKKAKTNFIFEARTINKRGKVKLIGENKQFAKSNRSFTLTGTINKNKLIAESLTYNYRAKDAKTGNSKRLYGTVKR